ncbi:MAG: ABC transporter ATP-binding protein [Gammaproteobacteria bacterium]|nr:ABC transporter ATP-binding protein [Gammaproteobacteria bacterium]MDE0452276.1 ABC transporter ATP-binding protein [Gammaproteobacteria bacterium]
MSLEFRGVSHRFGGDEVLKRVTFTAEPGEITCLLGASGSGKSTLLRLAAGLERIQAGEIRLDGDVLSGSGTATAPEHRPVGLVFQEQVLFPHKTALENVAYGLHELNPPQRRTVAQSNLDAVGLGEFSARYPDTLSGGQQQRVALARALAPAPRVMLLDEPFANVDATLRRALREDARRALRNSGGITVIVTHDPEEALELADRIAVMDHGRIVQVETPDEVWHRPAGRAVAGLFGQAQHLEGTAETGCVTTAFGRLDWPCEETVPGDTVDVLVRPNAVALERVSEPSAADGRVEDIRFLGDRYLVLVQSNGETLRASIEDRDGIRVGDPVTVKLDRSGTFVYAATDG